MSPDYIDLAVGTIPDINTAHIETPYREERAAFAYGPSGLVEDADNPIHYSAPGQRIMIPQVR